MFRGFQGGCRQGGRGEGLQGTRFGVLKVRV